MENQENIEQRRRNYEEICFFQNEEEFQNWFSPQIEQWTKRWSHEGLRFSTDGYTCRFKRRENNNCKVIIKVQRNNTGTIIILQSGDHEHQEQEEKQRFTEEQRQLMRELISYRQTAGQIQDELLSQFGNAPALIQITNFIQREKTKMGVNAPVSVQDLRKYVTDNLEGGAFMVSGKIFGAEKFCIVWTTPKLRDNQRAAKNIHIDATYKILSSGFPMLRAGYTDANAKFFPTFAAIASSEDAWAYNCFFKSIGSEYSPQQLMADSAPQITKAQKEVWPNALRATCYFHVMKALRDKFSSRSISAERDVILPEVSLLQMASNMTEFMEAARQLNNEWGRRYRNNEEVLAALKSFVNFYILNEDNNGWFAGFSDYQSTNNGLESANSKFKDRDTFRRRVHLRDFFGVAEAAVRKWTELPEFQKPANRPEIPTQTFKRAYELQQEGRLLHKEGLVYLMAANAGKDEMKSADDLIAAYRLLTDFDAEDGEPDPTYESWQWYVQLKKKFYIISASDAWPGFYKCSCYDGRKKACPHGVMIMVLNGTADYPAEITAELIGKRRKKGRPKKVKGGTALIRN